MPNKKLHLSLVATAALLGACASPILQLDGRGYSVADSQPIKGEPVSMTQAIQKLDYFHAKYYEAIRDQQNTVQNTAAGLVWLGAGIAGMAAGNVHRDAILGASLVGGTTYAVTRTQLDARRIDVWQEGMEALDCAKEASIPLDIGDTKQKDLLAARISLSGARVAVQQAREKVQSELDAVAKTPSPRIDAAREAIKKADAALPDADKTVSAADRLLQAARGLELSAAVDRINSKVTRAMNSFQLDISSVKQMVAGIGGYAAIFAPGVDTTYADAFSKYASATGKVAGQLAPQASPQFQNLDNAVDKLGDAMQSLASAQSRTKSLLGDVDTAAVSEALKRCNVAMPPVAITLSPASLSFPKDGGTKAFAIAGGTPPYGVELLDVPADRSVSISFQGLDTDRADVVVTGAAPAGDYTVRVKDSSTAKRQQTLAVHVDAAASAPQPGASATANQKLSDPNTSAAWNAFIAALKKPDFTRKVQDVTISVQSATLTGGRLRVFVKCDKAPAQSLPIDTLRALIATADKASVDQLKQAKALDANLSQIDVSPTPSCVKS